MIPQAGLLRIVDALEGKREGSSWRCRCPIHEGHSLIATERDGKILVKCHGGCDQEAVITALRERDLWPNGEPRRPTDGRPEAEYRYVDIGGAVVAVKGRFRRPNGEKTFAWKRPGADAWSGLGGLKECDLPLYNTHLLPTAAGPVVIVEGEKAASACLDAGLLALCAPGGAAAKDFGDQLKPLAGLDLILWPDNDDEGRGLMQRLSIRLQGIAACVRTIQPDVPPRGDAFDYFQSGGTKDDLLHEIAAIKTAPEVAETPTGYRVGVPTMGGAAVFEFSDLEERRHALDAELVVWAEIPGMSREPFSGRLNLLSLSQRDTFRRQLEDVVPLGKGGWTALINRAVGLVRQTYSEADPSIDLSALPDVDLTPRYLAPPLVPMDGSSILFGRGGSAKTYLALLMACCIAKGENFLGLPAHQGGVLFVDYESTAQRIRARVRRILTGLGLEWNGLPFTYWPGRGRPLPDMVPALQRKIRDADVSLLVVDSAALACGGEPEKAETALRYFNALSALGLPSLTIAHLTKQEQDEYPFGSIFWSNSARLTWNVQASQEDERNVTHLGLFCRKSNEERLAPPFGVRMEFDAQAVHFSNEELQAGTSDRRAMPGRIRNVLREGARSVKELVEELDLPDNAVRAYLARIHDVRRLGTADDKSGLWGLKANE